MSFETFLVVVVVANVLSAAISFVIARGADRDPFPWVLFGLILGPIGLILLLGVLSRGRGPGSPN